MKKILLVVLGFFGSAAQAQMMVPPIERTAFVAPSMEAVPTRRAELNDKEQKALEIALEWKNNPNKPRRSGDGGVIYLFGATLPTLICTPLQVCAIRLQPGETVNEEPHAGDSVRWIISPSMIGSGPTAITVVMVKPTDSGIVTNLIINTNRRSYNLKLMATRHEWVSYVAFDYPDDNARAWENYRMKQGRVEQAATLATGENTDALDFGFTMAGDNPKWKPVRVWRNAQGKTNVQFASDKFLNDAPALVVIGKGGSLWSGPSTQIINYRPVGDRYVVDGIPDQMALISGVGNEQVKVTIDYTGGKK